MSQITKYILQVNISHYNKQCRYVKKKLLSVDSCDISCITFFKKSHVILHNLPDYLVELDVKIDEKMKCWFDFWDELHDDTHFDDNKRLMQLKCIKLTNNIYQVSFPV